jgi:hypothetical protein
LDALIRIAHTTTPQPPKGADFTLCELRCLKASQKHAYLFQDGATLFEIRPHNAVKSDR